jgi:hypothetical protein
VSASEYSDGPTESRPERLCEGAAVALEVSIALRFVARNRRRDMADKNRSYLVSFIQGAVSYSFHIWSQTSVNPVILYGKFSKKRHSKTSQIEARMCVTEPHQKFPSLLPRIYFLKRFPTIWICNLKVCGDPGSLSLSNFSSSRWEAALTTIVVAQTRTRGCW